MSAVDVPVTQMETRELATAVFHLKDQRTAIGRNIWLFEAELRKRMAELKVEALPDSVYDIRLEKGGSPRYSADVLRSQLGELLTPEEMALLIEEVPASERVSGRFARSLSTRYRGQVAEVIAEARTDPEQRLSIKKRG